MITGAHVIVYSTNADADRAFFRDVLGYPHVDAGGGWLIFKLPPAEVALHPVDGGASAELYLMCDDLDATVADLAERGVSCSPPADQGWGILTTIRLPGGGDLGLYQPRHERATDLEAPAVLPTVDDAVLARLDEAQITDAPPEDRWRSS